MTKKYLKERDDIRVWNLYGEIVTQSKGIEEV